MPSFFFDHALLPDGPARNVRVTVNDGVIDSVSPDSAPQPGEGVRGFALPGLPNLHCHAFQRGMAGLAETRGPAHDSFWTWREIMYRFLDAIEPDDVEAIAAFAYMEMLESGFTHVTEFHYLHHDPHGHPYADIAELAGRCLAAAADVGIGMTMLPSLYRHGGFGGAAAVPGQRRFLNDVDRFLALTERTRALAAAVADARVGIAPHSLRAVTPEMLRDVVAAVPDGPVHIHVAEQVKEVEDCIAWSGRRPVEWLLDHVEVDRRWCLIHATHATPAEIEALTRRGATVGLCPLTEANLGDGIFAADALLTHSGAFGVGTDSNIEITAAGELKQLEYSQRLHRRRRNVLTEAEGQSTGRVLYDAALAGGARAADRRIGRLAPGHRADIVVIDIEKTHLAALPPAQWLDGYIFVHGRAAVDSVFVGGERIVSAGVHVARERIARRYRRTLARIMAA